MYNKVDIDFPETYEISAPPQIGHLNFKQLHRPPLTINSSLIPKRKQFTLNTLLCYVLFFLFQPEPTPKPNGIFGGVGQIISGVGKGVGIALAGVGQGVGIIVEGFVTGKKYEGALVGASCVVAGVTQGIASSVIGM